MLEGSRAAGSHVDPRGWWPEEWAQVAHTLQLVERANVAEALRFPATSPSKLSWRAHAARRALHILPDDKVLEIGAGAGLWTRRLASALRGECEVTAAVFDADLAERAESRLPPEVGVVHVATGQELPVEHYDHVVGMSALSHPRYRDVVRLIRLLLTPGGQVLVFEDNHSSPLAVATARRTQAMRRRNADRRLAVPRSHLLAAMQAEGFIEIEAAAHDILPARTPRRLMPAARSTAFLLEHVPGARGLGSTVRLSARRNGAVARDRSRANLARHVSLQDAVSIVLPCRNEAVNIPTLVDALIAHYDGYIREILVVNDNSDDDTATVVASLARREPRVRLLNRQRPPGVGLALKAGYAAATGRYILSMDCDFEMLVPELRDLFDAVAAGREGAIGSRFSHWSVLRGYPAGKLLANRSFHLLVRLLLRKRVRDISNNLKLYRGDLLRDLDIEEDGFAANAETGLKPLLEGRDIVEVPISWIDRSPDMGASTFAVARVAPGYARVLLRALRRDIRG